MFKLSLSPQAGTSDTTISVDGDLLTYNGVEYDFSTIEEGDIAEGEFPTIGEITCVNGAIELNLMFNYDQSTAELNQSTDPNDYIVEIETGDVQLPIVRKPEPVEEPIIEEPVEEGEPNV